MVRKVSGAGGNGLDIQSSICSESSLLLLYIKVAFSATSTVETIQYWVRAGFCYASNGIIKTHGIELQYLLLMTANKAASTNLMR